MSIYIVKVKQYTRNMKKHKLKRDRFSVALYATEQRSPKMKNSTQTTLPHFNDVTSRLIILINEEINKANCVVRNSAKLDRRTKEHTQFGVSTIDGSRDMARTCRGGGKKKEKKRKMDAGKTIQRPLRGSLNMRFLLFFLFILTVSYR